MPLVVGRFEVCNDLPRIRPKWNEIRFEIFHRLLMLEVFHRLRANLSIVGGKCAAASTAPRPRHPCRRPEVVSWPASFDQKRTRVRHFPGRSFRGLRRTGGDARSARMCCCRYSHGEPAHMPVHTHVFAACRMARNVRPLKVLEGGVKLPPRLRRCCCVQLCHPVDRTRNPQITATPRHTRTNSLLAGRNFRLVVRSINIVTN